MLPILSSGTPRRRQYARLRVRHSAPGDILEDGVKRFYHQERNWELWVAIGLSSRGLLCKFCGLSWLACDNDPIPAGTTLLIWGVSEPHSEVSREGKSAKVGDGGLGVFSCAKEDILEVGDAL